MNKNLIELYSQLDIKPKSNFAIDLVYNILNPIVSSYFNIEPSNTNVISKDIKNPILYLSRHYDEIDILCQQKISKEYRGEYPSYLVKKNLSFLNYFGFGVIPYYRGKDKQDAIKSGNYKKEDLDNYNKKIISELIPLILSNNQDFLIYPEGTRRKGKKFKVQNKVLEDIVTIYNNSKEISKIMPQIISIDYLREDKNIKMRFGTPLVLSKRRELNIDELREYLYSNIVY